MNSLVPSGSPTPYNISVGWNTSELSLGMKGEGRARAGWIARPVEILNAERGWGRAKECIIIRCDLQYAGVMADVLRNYEREVHTRLSMTYAAKTFVVECTSKAESPLGWTSHVFTALSDPRRSHNFTWPSKLCFISSEIRKTIERRNRQNVPG
jgi:hypothetical protein